MNFKNHIPSGKMEAKWDNYKNNSGLVSPSNRKKYHIIVVGTGLAGASAASTLSEQGYQVSCFCYQDSPRRAHSISAQGGINASKNYQNDGDSTRRLFFDTLKGGDFRSREENVYRLAQLSTNIIDQCVAQGVPFARDYGGYLDNRSFGGTQVSRTFFARGQTGQQLLIGAYSLLSKQIGLKKVKMYTRHEMMDLVVIDGHAKGIITRNLINGKIESWSSDAVIIASGGYSNVFYLSTNAQGCNVTAIYRSYKRGAGLANPCFTQIHPTCLVQHSPYQSKLTLMSESLRNDGRIWVPKNQKDCMKDPKKILESSRDYFLERKYPSFGNLAPRDISSRAAKEVCDEGRSIVSNGRGVYLDFEQSIKTFGKKNIKEKYGNLFSMYKNITGDDAYKIPMKIYPAAHYTMGGLWVDYSLMNNIPGLFVIGEANFSDHGANRLGASALMQGLADGYFIVPISIGNYFSKFGYGRPEENHPKFKEIKFQNKNRIDRLLKNSHKGTISPREFHNKLGKVMRKYCGMDRNKDGLKIALHKIYEIEKNFYKKIKIIGDNSSMNMEIERGSRVEDFIKISKVMCLDALKRNESCGSHFRTEYQTVDGEMRRNDENFSHVSIWIYKKHNPMMIREKLIFKECIPNVRSYK
jgi:succinate dehydrogenase / fumarate reductase flavoprotein subunit